MIYIVPSNYILIMSILSNDIDVAVDFATFFEIHSINCSGPLNRKDIIEPYRFTLVPDYKNRIRPVKKDIIKWAMENIKHQDLQIDQSELTVEFSSFQDVQSDWTTFQRTYGLMLLCITILWNNNPFLTLTLKDYMASQSCKQYVEEI